MKKNKLRQKIIDVLLEQGFKIDSKIRPTTNSKSNYRRLQAISRKEQIELHRGFLVNNIPTVKKYLDNVKAFEPSKIELELKEVIEGTVEEVLFKWWNFVWWSVPYQRAYGRQMRFILWDKTHDAPFGLIGLQSPVLKMSVRDDFLEIPNDKLDVWVNKSMQAQRLGALPPYNYLIGGKMVAMAATSNELRRKYRAKYNKRKTEMLHRNIEPDLLFITTTSAFGKSSIYNRIKYNDELVAQSLGYTKGYGSFHIPEALYLEIKEYLVEYNVDVNTSFGSGPSRKLKLLDKAFKLLDIPSFTNHNLQREYYLFPLASNLKNVIKKNVNPRYFNRPLKELTSYWKDRWCLPRINWDKNWRNFSGDKFLKNIKRSNQLK